MDKKDEKDLEPKDEKDLEPKGKKAFKPMAIHVKLPSAPMGRAVCAVYTKYQEAEDGIRTRQTIQLMLSDGILFGVESIDGRKAPEGFEPDIEDLLAAGFVRF